MKDANSSPLKKYSTNIQQPNGRAGIYQSSSYHKGFDDSRNNSSQLSASFSSKQYDKDDQSEPRNRDMTSGYVIYTESVLSASQPSSTKTRPRSKLKTIEPVLQQQMDQLKCKLTRYLKVKKDE